MHSGEERAPCHDSSYRSKGSFLSVFPASSRTARRPLEPHLPSSSGSGCGCRAACGAPHSTDGADGPSSPGPPRARLSLPFPSPPRPELGSGLGGAVLGAAAAPSPPPRRDPAPGEARRGARPLRGRARPRCAEFVRREGSKFRLGLLFSF